MSKSVVVEFAGRMFWAYDVSLGILLLEAIDVAGESPTAPFTDVLDDMMTQAEIGASYAFQLDWDDERRRYAMDLIAEAARRIRDRGVIPADEANRRYRIDGKPFHLRMAEQIDGAVVADLADKIELLIRDELPPVPEEGRHWYFGGSRTSLL